MVLCSDKGSLQVYSLPSSLSSGMKVEPSYTLNVGTHTSRMRMNDSRTIAAVAGKENMLALWDVKEKKRLVLTKNVSEL